MNSTTCCSVASAPAGTIHLARLPCQRIRRFRRCRFSAISRLGLWALWRSPIFVGRTGSARNWEVIFPCVPSRQVTVTAASLPAASASALSEDGPCW
jgi:hypothetical protein